MVKTFSVNVDAIVSDRARQSRYACCSCDSVADDSLSPSWPWADEGAHIAAAPRRRAIRWRHVGRVILLSAVALYGLGTTVRIYARRYNIFLADYVRRAWTTAPEPT